jgi:hypothetical protein
MKISVEEHNRQVIERGHAYMLRDDWQPSYSSWRHGGWYVHGITYPNGGCGCVSNNYADKKWRIVCEGGKYATLEEFPSYPTREAAAFAERQIAIEQMKVLEALV